MSLPAVHRRRRGPVAAALFVLLLTTALISRAQTGDASQQTRVPVVFSGGYDTDPRDRGRPVILIAAALGVTPDVFRAAFSGVHPAPAGQQPQPDQVRKNKQVLMAALGPYGVTDDRLNTVSNYYRYSRSRGEMWRNTPATAFALVEDGKVVGFSITNGGSGYSSPPLVKVPGFDSLSATAQLVFGKEFDKNGSISEITIQDKSQ